MTRPAANVHGSRAWLFGALAVVFARALPNVRFPLGRDQATYALIAQWMLHGLRLYRDLWDNKPPGIFYVYVPIVKLFGPVMWCVGVMDVVWLLLISYGIFRFVERRLGAPAAALTVLFNAAWHSTQGYVHAGQPETWLMLFVFAAYLLMRPEGPEPAARWLLAGLAMGAAFWLKYNAVLFLPFVFVLPFVDFAGSDAAPRRVRLNVPRLFWLRAATTAGVGFLLALIAMTGHLWLSGAWPGFKEEQFQVLPRYGALVLQHSHPFLRRLILQTYFHLGAWNEAVVAAALFVAWWRRELAATAPIFIMGLAGYCLTVSQGRFHPYYFETTYPLIAMCWGYVCVRIFDGFRALSQSLTRRGWRLARVLLWVVFANLVYYGAVTEAFRIGEQYQSLAFWWRDPERSYAEYLWQIDIEKLHDQLAVIDYLKAHSSPRDEVYVWGTAPAVNLLAQRRTATRFVSNLGLISPWGLPQWRAELVHDLKQTRPRYIIVARHDAIFGVSYTHQDSEQILADFPALARLIRHGYQSVRNFDDFEIYRLK